MRNQRPGADVGDRPQSLAAIHCNGVSFMSDTAATLRVAALVGSLRARSFNRALLRAAIPLAPAGMQFQTFDRLGEIPPYNDDVLEQGVPPSVVALKDLIRGADGLLIVTPEYNYGIPGVLKNAIDWASRPAADTPLADKPAAIMGVAARTSGTARAQLQLRQNLVFTNTLVMVRPEVLVQHAAERFNAELELVDEPTRKAVAAFLTAFAAWINRLARR